MRAGKRAPGFEFFGPRKRDDITWIRRQNDAESLIGDIVAVLNYGA
jgi:hypothetical protein